MGNFFLPLILAQNQDLARQNRREYETFGRTVSNFLRRSGYRVLKKMLTKGEMVSIPLWAVGDGVWQPVMKAFHLSLFPTDLGMQGALFSVHTLPHAYLKSGAFGKAGRDSDALKTTFEGLETCGRKIHFSPNTTTFSPGLQCVTTKTLPFLTRGAFQRAEETRRVLPCISQGRIATPV